MLFAGVKMSYTIFTYAKRTSDADRSELFMSKLYRWLAIERDTLFALVEHHPALRQSDLGIPFKVGSKAAARVIEKVRRHVQTISYLEKRSGVPLLYHRIVRHFIKALFKAPYFWNERDGEKKSDDYKLVLFEGKHSAQLVRSFLLSSTYYVFFVALSDAYHCGRELVLSFPVGIDKLPKDDQENLIALGIRYEKDLFKNSVRRRIQYKATGWIEYDEFYPRQSKHIADEIDRALAGHYQFNDEDLDFIINYDIKYRIGREAESEEE